MNDQIDRGVSFPSANGPSGTLYEHWSAVCYIPHNDAFSITMASAGQDGAYNRTIMGEIHDERIAEAEKGAQEAIAGGAVTEDDQKLMQQVFEWVKTSTRVLLDHIAQMGAVGDLPAMPTSRAIATSLTDYQASDLGQLAIRIASLPGTPFMGWHTPTLEARFSKHHQQGIIIDIVPSDPRFGGHIPDWGVPDSGERRRLDKGR